MPCQSLAVTGASLAPALIGAALLVAGVAVLASRRRSVAPLALLAVGLVAAIGFVTTPAAEASTPDCSTTPRPSDSAVLDANASRALTTVRDTIVSVVPTTGDPIVTSTTIPATTTVAPTTTTTTVAPTTTTTTTTTVYEGPGGGGGQSGGGCEGDECGG